MKTLTSKKKIIISIVALVVALVVATGSTYAWFTMGNTVTLDDFQVGVTTETDNLFVAVGTINDTPGTPAAYNYGDLESISTSDAATYDIDTNTYKVSLSQNTINDLLIHQYGAMVLGEDGYGNSKNYPLIPFNATQTVVSKVGTGYAKAGVNYFDTINCDTTAHTTADVENPLVLNTTDVSKYFVKGTIAFGTAPTEYFYYFDESTHTFNVVSRTGTGTGADHFVYTAEVSPNTAFDAITTADGKTFTDLKGNTVTAIEAVADDDHMANYTEFKVYFRSTSAAYAISLAKDSEVVAKGNANKVTAWNDDITEEHYGKTTLMGNNLEAHAADAVRISFDNGTDTFIWNPNAESGYYKGNLADDYWGYIHGDNLARTNPDYVASYNAFLARDYKVTNDTAAQPGVKYYQSIPQYAMDGGVSDENFASYKIPDTITACTATSVFEKGKLYYVSSNAENTDFTSVIDPASYEIGETIQNATIEGRADATRVCTVTFVAPDAYDAADTYYSTIENAYVESDWAVGTYEKTTVEKCSETTDGGNTTHNNGTILTTLTYNSDTNYYEGVITVRIWIEGWDGDCFNDILSEFFETSLAFDGHAVQA